jgi:hypothetical protein
MEIELEKVELKMLLKEKYDIPLNSGSLPGAVYNIENIKYWIYPATKSFRTY